MRAGRLSAANDASGRDLLVSVIDGDRCLLDRGPIFKQGQNGLVLCDGRTHHGPERDSYLPTSKYGQRSCRCPSDIDGCSDSGLVGRDQLDIEKFALRERRLQHVGGDVVAAEGAVAMRNPSRAFQPPAKSSASKCGLAGTNVD